MSARARPEPFEPAEHDVHAFSCGVRSLDDWLQRSAGQAQRRDAARTFVATIEGAVVAYYSLVAGEVTHAQASPQSSRGLSRHFPIPVAILARLAVDSRHQGLGLGTALVDDALDRVLRAGQEIGIRAVLVHATDDATGEFYARWGFIAARDTPRALMVTTAALREARQSP